ncbi:uncharacterized protein LOC110426109 [Herrania umbratica]|uniref:Uncharacterized protein LOC110426109 n=1 Tax=Herrania umbratica TaxID=108875 RepID=A0A6J1BCL7_9ROSI|nr:uncharacterized protein LOC110426109 [Herrania umbratica]
MEKALRWGGHQWIEGKRVVVQKAEPVHREKVETRVEPIKKIVWETGTKGVGGRSFKEVVQGGREEETMEEWKVKPTKEKVDLIEKNEWGNKDESMIQRRVGEKNIGSYAQEGSSRTTINSDIPEEDMRWIQNSAIGRLKKRIECGVVQSKLLNEGIQVQVRVIEGLSPLVTFEGREEMNTLLENYREIFEVWFDSLIPIDIAKYDGDVRLWVGLYDIPVHLWLINIFKAIGKRWGKLMGVDMGTFRRERFD